MEHKKNEDFVITKLTFATSKGGKNILRQQFRRKV